jgi:hypothetical protein
VLNALHAFILFYLIVIVLELIELTPPLKHCNRSIELNINALSYFALIQKTFLFAILMVMLMS